ncbi:hypothetical protein [Streptomyces sp. NPDC021212]|uniref:hypothetical protein n=1 Tax=Streptomyces sp. NPDC021212 TaxID=3365118 RepID=UPI0037ACCAC0
MTERPLDPDPATESVPPPTGALTETAALVTRVAGAGDDVNHQVSELERKTAGKHITAIATAWVHSLALTAEGRVVAAGTERIGRNDPGVEEETSGRHIIASPPVRATVWR